jgi:hypothetical protein
MNFHGFVKIEKRTSPSKIIVVMRVNCLIYMFYQPYLLHVQKLKINISFQGATSPKMYLDNWNIQTAVWLRLVCYDRIPVMKKFATFFLSAMWHGCYPGYYFTFIFANFVSESARNVS